MMIKKILLPLTLILLGLALWYSPIFKEVAAGVAILLIGMAMLENGFKYFTHGVLERIIKNATDKLYKSLGIGFLSTTLLQSSSLVSVVVISFISAGLLSLHAGIGVIFGANIGTTTTAWLISIFGLKVKISALSMPMLVFGVLLTFRKKESLKALGSILAGLGLFFLGVYFMKEGFDSLKENINLSAYAVSGFWGLIIYTGIGILVTIILQSSSATLALILTALAASQITYYNALALAIGANVGTTITAILGSLNANVGGKRLAGAHFIFNIITGLIALVFIYQLGAVVNLISTYIGIVNTNYTFKLSLFHTIFNIVGVLVMTPFIHPMVKLLDRVFVEEETVQIIQPKYLNSAVLMYPNTAINALLKESKRLFEEATFEIVSHGLNLHRADIKSDSSLKKIVKSSKEDLHINIDELYYQRIKVIYSKIIEFSSLAQSKFKLNAQQTKAFNNIILANRNIVHTLKTLRGLQPNVSKYMVSNNKYMLKEYNHLREKISAILREIYRTRKDKHPKKHLKDLEKLKKKVRKSNVLANGTLDKLIRKKLINSEMAASLANDNDDVVIISENLINVAELLYINNDTLLFEEE